VDNRLTTIIAEAEKARKGLVICAVVFLVSAFACFAVSERILLVMVQLLGKKLVSYSPQEGFFALASLSLYCAFVLTLPVAAYLVWRGAILPRAPRWRWWGGPILLLATALFLCGAFLGYFILLPAGIGFLVGFEARDIRALISAQKFISFCGTMLIGLGLAF
jgi:sec-independent protein translocase protein TatC